MRVLLIGAGLVGTVYGVQLARGGHEVDVLDHGHRTDQVALDGLLTRDLRSGISDSAAVKVARRPPAARCDLVLVAVPAEQLQAACEPLTDLAGEPSILLLGNNSRGMQPVPPTVREQARQGFAGIAGVVRDGIAEYVQVRQQPTSLPTSDDLRLEQFEQCLRNRSFPVRRVDDMSGWLVYHEAFIACIGEALLRSGGDPKVLGADRALLKLTCGAITEAFAALRKEQVQGLPSNLALLHHAGLQTLAVRYWSRVMRGPDGETYFAAHARHSPEEMDRMAIDTAARIPAQARRLHELLDDWRTP